MKASGEIDEHFFPVAKISSYNYYDIHSCRFKGFDNVQYC